jgi:DNA-binding MarR family transcriptional regulator
VSVKSPKRKTHVRLTDQQRRHVRWFYRHDYGPQSAIACMFRVSQSTVSNITRSR